MYTIPTLNFERHHSIYLIITGRKSNMLKLDNGVFERVYKSGMFGHAQSITQADTPSLGKIPSEATTASNRVLKHFCC